MHDPPARRILVAIDGSSASVAATRWALSLARVSGAEVTLLQVIEDEGPLPTESEKPPPGRERVEWLAERRFSPVAAELGPLLASCRRRVADGVPPDMICNVARLEGSDLIVMGSRGLSAAGRLLLGSVSGAVLRHAPCSVLVTR